MKIEEVLEQKRDLERQIQIVTNDLSRLPDIKIQQRELLDWKWQMDSLMNKYQNNPDLVMKSRPADYSLIKDKIEKLGNQVQHHIKVESEARSLLSKLTEELGSLDLSVSIKELLALQSKTAEVEKVLSGLYEAMSLEQNKIEGEEHSNSQRLVELTEERESVLADIATGNNADNGQLEQVEKQLTVEEKLHEEHVYSCLTASHTISGLNRKIAKAEEELSLLRNNLNNAIISFIKAEIDQAGKDYTDLAGKFSDTFMRIISLATLCEKLGTPINIFGPYTSQFKIPSFALDVCQKKESSDMAGMLFRFAAVNRQEALRNEIDSLTGIGLKLSA